MRSAALVLVAACSLPPFTPGDGPGGHDEDMDLIPDVDDPCPHLADGNHDSDGDGLGDKCDPDPTPGDMKRFYAFADDPRADLDIRGAFLAQGDQIDIGSTDGKTSFLWIPDTFIHARIEITFEVIATGTDTYHELAIRTGHTAMEATGAANMCDIGQFASTTYFEASDSVAASAQDSINLPDPLVGITGHFQVDQDVGSVTCELDRPNQLSHVVMEVPKNFGAGQVGISAHDVTVRVRYLFAGGR